MVCKYGTISILMNGCGHSFLLYFVPPNEMHNQQVKLLVLSSSPHPTLYQKMMTLLWFTIAKHNTKYFPRFVPRRSNITRYICCAADRCPEAVPTSDICGCAAGHAADGRTVGNSFLHISCPFRFPRPSNPNLIFYP